VVTGGVAATVTEFRWYKGRRHYSGWYWSATVGRLVAYESWLELARIMLADFDPLVTAIAAQPFRLAGPGRHRTRRHVPDILLGYAAGGVTVVDVKAPGKRPTARGNALLQALDHRAVRALAPPQRDASQPADQDPPPC